MAQFKNNRDNGAQQMSAPSVVYNVGDFLTPDGLGHFLPYVLSTTVLTGAYTGTFVLGETVSQATSGATGVVVAIGGTVTGLALKSVTGTFDATHLLTGGTSGATATATAATINKKIFGVSNQQVQSTESSYTTSQPINISTPVKI